MRYFIIGIILLWGIQPSFGQTEEEKYKAWLDSMKSETYIGVEMQLDPVVVTDSARLAQLTTPMMLMKLRSTDQLMHRLSGVNMIRRGSFANEPLLRGLTSDRYVISIDGMRIYGACTDKMDPASAYIEPINLKSLDVSFGSGGNTNGSATGGGINFGLKKPVFNPDTPFKASANTSYYSVSHGFDQSLDLNYFMKKLALRLSGVHRKAGNYSNGRGEKVRYSQFEKTNYSASLNYRLNKNSMLTVDFVGDDARNVGYPALPMDVAFAKAKMMALAYLTDKLWVLREPEIKLYHNSINHEMDDTQREQVAMHMDMPGNTRTTGGFIKGLLHNGQKSRLSLQADFHKVFWHAEMTMYPNNPNQKPMFMLTWPDIHRSVAGINLGHRYSLDPNQQLQGSLRIARATSFISSNFGERQLSVFDKSGTRHRNETLINLSAGHSLQLGQSTQLTSSLAYGERLPTASEQFGFYLFNQQDGYDYLGDPDLKKERNIHLEFRQSTQKQNMQLETAVFTYWFNDYIMGVYDPSLSNMTIGARGVKWHRNTGDALMLGGEVRIKNQWFGTLKSELNAQYVYGQDADGEPLPQIPPLKISYTIDQEVGQWSFQPEFIWSSAQSRVSSKFNERATDSFFLANLGISKNIKLPSGAFRMTLSVNNLFDVAYREHFDIGSILRPGRSIDVLLSWNLN